MKKVGLFFVLVLTLLITATHLRAQEKPDFDALIGKLASYAELAPPDKVYLHTDKDLYTNGETIWFKAYALNGITHLESDKSRVVYVELLNPKDSIIAQRKIHTAVDWAAGDIVLPKDMEEGTHVLRAYTNYMLNDKEPVFFQKEIPIWQQQITPSDSPENTLGAKEVQDNISEVAKPLVQFFPEGGNLVSGLKNGLGMKITDGKGTGIALEGTIVDGNGNEIVPFRSFEFGLSSAYFEIKPDTEYYAQIDFNGVREKYPLPKPLSNGYALQLSNQGKHIVIRISTNIDNGLKGTLLLGHLRGRRIFKHFEHKGNNDTFEAKLLTSELADGVAHFTLFAPNGEPVCERLTFIENPENEVEITLRTDKADYGFREQVDLELAVQDAKGETLDGRFSMSVVTGNGLKKETPTIKSWLLLDSDLGGTVEDPNYFFEDGSKARDYMLDLLMMTHGWRRFVLKSFFEEGVRPELAFPPEKGIMISGNTTAFDNPKQPLKTMATLNILRENVHQEKAYTNAQGRFSFGPFLFKDSVETVIEAKLFEIVKNREEIAIKINPPFPPVPIRPRLRQPMNTPTRNYALPYLKEVQRQKTNEFSYDSEVIQLDEAVVREKIKTRKEVINEALSERTLYGDTRHRIIPDSIPFAAMNSIFDLLVTVPGIQIIGYAPFDSIYITSAPLGEPPLFLLDGAQIDLEFIRNIPVLSVLFIDVLKHSEASIYGVRASGGVIAVYTKTGEYFGEEPETYPGVANFKVPGFYKAREFYAPNYAIPDSKHEKPDYRTTLHWTPEISLNEKDRSKLNFYTGDAVGKYVVRFEGVTADGRPVSALGSFSVLDDQ